MKDVEPQVIKEEELVVKVGEETVKITKRDKVLDRVSEIYLTKEEFETIRNVIKAEEMEE